MYLQKVKQLCALDSKYFSWYMQIILRAQSRAQTKAQAKRLLGYCESHHILPASFCTLEEKKDKLNLAHLSAKEHFICHLLLCKILPSVEMSTSLMFMTGKKNGNRYKSSRTYESFRLLARKYLSESKKGKPTSFSENNPGRSKENIKRMTENNPMSKLRVNKGTFKPGVQSIVWTDELKEKARVAKLGDKNPNYGNPLASSHLNKSDKKCPYCDVVTTSGNFSRWHGVKCKNYIKA